LRGECTSHCKDHPWSRLDTVKKSKNSIFYIDEMDYVADADDLDDEVNNTMTKVESSNK